MKVQVVSDIEIKSINGDYSVNVPKLYSKKNWPFTVDDSLKYV